MKYDKETLREKLKKHGYTPHVITPEWCQLALLLIIAENTDGKSSK